MKTPRTNNLAVGSASRLLGALLALSTTVLGCGDAAQPSEVVVYVSVDQAIAEPILARYAERTGSRVRPLFDTEATKTTGLANRIRREADRPRADVFWSSEPFAVHQLASEGRIQPMADEVWAAHPTAWRDPDGRWIAFAARGRVVAYDPTRLRPEDLPKTWRDVAAARWAGEVAIADPRFGTTRGHLGAMKAGWGPEAYTSWVRAMGENSVAVLPGGNAATVDAVVRGEVLLGLTDTDDVLAAKARGLTVEAFMPDHDPRRPNAGGTLMIPNSAGVVAGTSRPEPANAFLAFLGSAEVERMLRDSTSGNLQVAHPVVGDAGAAAVAARRAWEVPIPRIADQMDAAVTEAMDAWGDS